MQRRRGPKDLFNPKITTVDQETGTKTTMKLDDYINDVLIRHPEFVDEIEKIIRKRGYRGGERGPEPLLDVDRGGQSED